MSCQISVLVTTGVTVIFLTPPPIVRMQYGIGMPLYFMVLIFEKASDLIKYKHSLLLDYILTIDDEKFSTQ